MEVPKMKKRSIAGATTDHSSKKSKIDTDEVPEPLLVDQYSSRSSPDNALSPTISDHVPSSMCSGNHFSILEKNRQLESFDSKEPEILTLSTNGGFRESNLSTELDQPEPEKMESSTKKKPSPSTSRRESPPSKMPSAAEIEKFFVVSEKYEQKRFAEKYNYDIVNDVPMEGRYQWVLLKP